jgi:hypothetical protein
MHNPQHMLRFVLNRLSKGTLRALYHELHPLDESNVLDYWTVKEFVSEIELSTAPDIFGSYPALQIEESDNVPCDAEIKSPNLRKECGESEPYFVEVDENGCPKCGSGRLWVVVDPDGVRGSTSYGLEEDADDLAEDLNIAFGKGLATMASRLRLAEEKLRQFEIEWDGEKYVFTPKENV